MPFMTKIVAEFENSGIPYTLQVEIDDSVGALPAPRIILFVDGDQVAPLTVAVHRKPQRETLRGRPPLQDED